MNLPTVHSAKGFSITELLIVLAIVLTVSAFAFMQVVSSKESLEMQNVADEFKVYLERARFDSVKRSTTDVNEMAKVTIDSPTSFISHTDLNQNGKLELRETRKIDFSHQEQVRFFGDDSVFPIVISFNKRGQTTAIDASGKVIKSTFLVCQHKCADIASESDSFQIVAVSPSGTVTILNGDELVDKAVTPKNVSTSTSADIKPLASTIPNDGTILGIDLNEKAKIKANKIKKIIRLDN